MIQRIVLSLLAGIAVFVGSTFVWWRYWPVLEVESQVKTKLPYPAFDAHFSNVTYNRSTRTGCGFVNAAHRPGAMPLKTHFILMPDGTLRVDPSDRLQGSTLQQLEALKNHTDYLALVYARCSAEY